MLRRLPAATTGPATAGARPRATIAATSTLQPVARRRMATVVRQQSARAAGLVLSQTAAGGSAGALGRCGVKWWLPPSLGWVQRRGLASAPVRRAMARAGSGVGAACEWCDLGMWPIQDGCIDLCAFKSDSSIPPPDNRR